MTSNLNHDDSQFIWSEQQQEIFKLADSSKNLNVRAGAGCAKTTTIVELCNYIPNDLSVLFCCFNKEIQKELARRLPNDVDCKTFHSIGFGAIRSHMHGEVQVDFNKSRDMCKQVPYSYGKLGKLMRLVGWAKNTLTHGVDGLARAAIGLQLDDPDAGCSAGWLAEAVSDLLENMEDSTSSIDFDDMIWLPVVKGWSPIKYDVVIIDERQDLNPTQLALVAMAQKPSGRVIAVGDPNQAIYSWRGAGSWNPERESKVVMLPLMTSYRCPRKVVALAQQVVPDFVAREDAPEGIISSCSTAELIGKASPGDFILSRKNAPLVKLCVAFLAAGVPAVIRGANIGKQVVALAQKSKAKGIEDMLVWLADYVDTTRKKADRLEMPELLATVLDQADALRTLSEGRSTVAELVAYVQGIFADTVGASKVMLSSVHKAKGLEADRVFVLTDTFGDRGRQEEANLWYVAITRTKSELVLVAGDET